jgi:hypothetical protein
MTRQEVIMAWQPIETAPKDGTEILIVRAEEDSAAYRVAYWDEDGDVPYMWHVSDAVDGFNHHKDLPTHWMPLPDSPDPASP